jgi:hypothetical protein
MEQRRGEDFGGGSGQRLATRCDEMMLHSLCQRRKISCWVEDIWEVHQGYDGVGRLCGAEEIQMCALTRNVEQQSRRDRIDARLDGLFSDNAQGFLHFVASSA